jgi:hypothetical protein
LAQPPPSSGAAAGASDAADLAAYFLEQRRRRERERELGVVGAGGERVGLDGFLVVEAKKPPLAVPPKVPLAKVDWSGYGNSEI